MLPAAIVQFLPMPDGGHNWCYSQTSSMSDEQHGRIRLHETRYIRRLSLRWLHSGSWFTIAMGLSVNGVIALGIHYNVLNQERWYQYLGPLFLCIIGFPLGHMALVEIFNSVHLTLRKQQLQLRQGPIPTGIPRDLEVAQIQQFFAAEKDKVDMIGESITTYVLWVVLKNGKRIQLLDNLLGGQEAHFVEKCLESWLRIEDQPVPGEIPKDRT